MSFKVRHNRLDDVTCGCSHPTWEDAEQCREELIAESEETGFGVDWADSRVVDTLRERP